MSISVLACLLALVSVWHWTFTRLFWMLLNFSVTFLYYRHTIIDGDFVPKKGYANFTIRKEAAEKLEEFSRRNGVSLVYMISAFAEKIDPNIELDTLLKAIEFASTIKFSATLKGEVLKVRCAQLYYYVEALSSIVSSLLKPSPFIDLKLTLIYKVWEKKVDRYTVLASAHLIDPSIDIIRLIENLEVEKNSLKRILDATWPNWMSEVERPTLMREISIPEEYLTISVKKEVLREELKPYFNEVIKEWREASEILLSLSTSYPELKELLWRGLEDFSKLFLITNLQPE